MRKTRNFNAAGALCGLLRTRASLVLVFSGFCFGGLTEAQEVEPKAPLEPVKPPGRMRHRITDEELKKIRAESPSTFDAAKAKPVEKAVTAVKRDIYQTSDILVDGAFHTVVPKGAILSVPESLGDRLASGAAGKFQFWPDFYARNKEWIKLQEVEIDVAKGKIPLPEAVIKMMATEPKVVIAVYKGNLVTVLEAPPKEDVAEESVEKKEKK